MKYCVTGGSGFIGSYFCETLAAEGHEITILDLVDPPETTPHDRFVYGDVRDPQAVRDAFEGCDRILHLAAAHHDFGIERDTFFDVNENGAQVICDAMDELKSCFEAQGASVVGAVSTDGYDHTDSKSVAGGKFVGLACDEDNQPDMSEDRVKAWIDQIKGEGMPL